MEVNKAGYTTTPVACGWAGVVFEVSHLGRSGEVKDHKHPKKAMCDAPMEGPTVDISQKLFSNNQV